MNPPIIVPSFITRDFIKEKENQFVFLYSAPINMNKTTGQIAQVLDSCCYPIPVRHSTCKSNGYFKDGDTLAQECVELWIAQIPISMLLDKPIIPFPNIGMGGSRMNEFAPVLLKRMTDLINKIKYPNIIYQHNEQQPNLTVINPYEL